MSEASSDYSAVVEDILKARVGAEEAGRDGVKPKRAHEIIPSAADGEHCSASYDRDWCTDRTGVCA